MSLKLHKKTWAVCEELSKGYTLFYNASDATKIPLREKPVKVEKKKKV